MLSLELRKLAAELEETSESDDGGDVEEQMRPLLGPHSRRYLLHEFAKTMRAYTIEAIKQMFPDWSKEDFAAAKDLLGSPDYNERGKRLAEDSIWFALEKLSR